ncbi:MAG: hypothetical protein LBS85_07250 [Clostridiales Family XIII bacterium]|jgi:hypothetical protein|nr:hypothetical protein [Clostridiales Family XIII bacterium]
MKDTRIVDSWNKIEPNAVAETRMLDAVLARNQSGKLKKEKVLTMTKTFNLKRLAPIAACFILVIALAAVAGNNAGWFGGNVYTADLGGGSTLSFYKSDMPGTGSFAFDFDVSSRDLTDSEIKILFGDLPAAAYAAFNAENHSFVRLEGEIGDTKVILAAPGAPLTDTIIQGNENVSEINGVPVTAGYFVTKANSQGVKTIICFASWKLGDVIEYVQLGGNYDDSEAFRNEIASVIERLIQNGTPDLNQIAE